MKRLLLAATTLALPLVLAAGRVQAQPVDGLYVGAGAGANFMMNETRKFNYSGTGPGGPFQGNQKIPLKFDVGATGVASVGYGFGNGLRLEVEGDYRYNEVRHTGGNAYEQKYGGMGNALFDFDIGSRYVFPYAGLGAGYMERDDSGHVPYFNAGGFAYQGIAGVGLPIPFVVGLSATVEYRFMGLSGVSHRDSFAAPGVTQVSQDKYTNDLNHSVMVGLRYEFGVVPPAPPPIANPTPVAAPARSYLVFFDWDRADLNDRARQIVAQAAQNVGLVEHTRIEVDGHADRTGSEEYNHRLSLRRAQAVAAELVRDGVPRTAIDVQAFGDTRPIVPTAAGVREPQNRRVEIVIK